MDIAGHLRFLTLVIQLLRDRYQTFMDMAWISVGYGLDIEGCGDSLIYTQSTFCHNTKIIDM